MKQIKRRTFLGVLGMSAAEAAAANMGRGAETTPASTETPKTEAPKKRPVFETDREDGRYVHTAGFLQAQLRNLRPKLAFDPDMKAEAFPAWQKAVREKLPEVLCFPEDVPPQPPPKKLWTRKRDGYRLEKWEAYPEPFCVVPFLVLIPDGASPQSPAPAVMCFPGSTSSKESLAGEMELDTGKPSQRKFATNKQAFLYTQKGFISVAVENPATNELAGPLRDRSAMSNCALWMGRNYLGISVFQKACILEWLSTLPFVDATRIAASGHSLGSNPADILGILYPDLVKAVVHNDFVCDWHERAIVHNFKPPGGAHHTVPGLFRWFDHTDLEAALAPCPLLFTEGGRYAAIERIRKAYKLLDAADMIKVFHYAKYATPEKRPFDGKEIPEGLTVDEYFQYANVDPSKHRFRGERAVPWLADVFGV